MKTGRNDSCPCGSGKKYKHCCLQNQTSGNDQTPGTAQSLADELANATTERQIDSIEEMNALATQLMHKRNRLANDDFCGLSPEQMTHLLYNPFVSPEIIEFSTKMAPDPDATIMRLFMTLVDGLGEDGLKTTATGNLPLKFCKAVAQQLRLDDDDSIRFRIGGIRSETDLEVLHCTRLVAQLAGFVRKYRGRFVLTRKCREMLDRGGKGAVYFELFKVYTTKFNWAYRDGYPEAELVQRSFLYTLFLLNSFGAAPRSQHFYEDKFLLAFPMAREMFPETTYHTAEQAARNCYLVRALDRFAVFFGLAKLEVVPPATYPRKYEIHKSALLDQFVIFNL